MTYLTHLAILFLYYALIAGSQQLLTGYSKLLTVSQAAVVGVGAYAAAIASTKYGVPYPVTVMIGSLFAMVLSGLAYGLFSRLDSEGVVLASLAFQIIVMELILNLEEFTNGALGIAGIHSPAYSGAATSTVILATLLICVCIMATFLHWLKKSHFGRRLLLIGENRAFAEALGLHVAHDRLIAFIISALMAGAAGGIFAHYLTFIEPGTFGLIESVFVLAIVVIAESKRILALLAVTAVLVIVPELMRFVAGSGAFSANIRQIVFGCILVLALAAPSFSRRMEHRRK
uniref:Branched-chain amino acid transport system permease protein n=1 Tax=Candidatus Kentrum sp. TC TaxID=2126339 RepID=A0A451A8J5_9GAMM|nr:MAG: branched-chain amino acid transport system permease protein [Candidatus Kentron sp. TC]